MITPVELMTPEQEFVRQCWEDINKKAKRKDGYQYLSDKFLVEDEKHRVIMDYVLKLHIQASAGERADAAEWGWRYGLAFAFGIIGLGNLLQWSMDNTRYPGMLFWLNGFAAIVIVTAPWWRVRLKR